MGHGVCVAPLQPSDRRGTGFAGPLAVPPWGLSPDARRPVDGWRLAKDRPLAADAPCKGGAEGASGGIHVKAEMPVIARPSTSAWMSCVPSSVFTVSRFIRWRITW
jgi:hypothetical protein